MFSLVNCQPSLKISYKSVRKFLRKVANSQTNSKTDKQTNNDENVTSLGSVTNVNLQFSLDFCQIVDQWMTRFTATVACVYRGHYTATVSKTATMEATKLLIVVSVTNLTNLAFHQSPHECLKIRSHSVRAAPRVDAVRRCRNAGWTNLKRILCVWSLWWHPVIYIQLYSPYRQPHTI